MDDVARLECRRVGKRTPAPRRRIYPAIAARQRALRLAHCAAHDAAPRTRTAAAGLSPFRQHPPDSHGFRLII
jgi:hypothetical protein